MKSLASSLIALLLSLSLLGCEIFGNSPSDTEGDFAIFLVENGDEQLPIDDLQLSAQPFLEASDLTSYDWRKHVLTYAPSVHARLQAHGDLYRRRFVVTVGDQRIYWGWFTSPIDSRAYQVPVIMLEPAGPGMPFAAPASMAISRGYPGDFGSGTAPDPREDARIRDALKSCNRLK